MLRSTITAGYATRANPTRRADGGVDATDDDGDQGEVLEAAEPRREAFRDPRLFVRAPARAAAERQAWGRRRGHGQEAPAAADPVAGAERRQARHPGSTGAGAGARGSGPPGARAQVGDSAAAAGAGRAGEAARGAAAEARRQRAAAFGTRRGVPLGEGSDQGAILRRRGP